jgi:hypothetical protein
MCKKRLALITAGVLFLLLQNVSLGTPLPEEVELIYDDGDPEGGVLLASGQIAAVKMSPPPGIWKLKRARYYLYQGEGKVRIFDDDAGRPGSDLVEGFSVTPSQVGWLDVDLAPYNITVAGEFYVGIEGVDAMTPCSIGHDFLGGGNGRAWDYFPDFEWMPNPDLTYFIRAVVTDEVGVEEELTPEPIIDLQCSPNPFSHSTTISYTLPQTGRVTVRIWDANGRCVRTLLDANAAGGYHSIRWDGADNTGTPLPTGVYFTRIDINHATLFRKVVLIR